MSREKRQLKNKQTEKSSRSRVVLIGIALAMVTIILYWRTAGYDFVNYDDNVYVTQNTQVAKGLTPEGITWAFTTFHGANWHPLTWLSFMVDSSLFGPKPGPLHQMNLLFHVANALLLLLILYRMTSRLWASAFVAALFALHPQHVESVAWIAERKDVLSTFFWLLTMGAYIHYVRKPSVIRYIPVVVFLALGLMAKPMLVTLPFVLLLLDVWPLGRLRVFCKFDEPDPLPVPAPEIKSKRKHYSPVGPQPSIVLDAAKKTDQCISPYNAFREKIPLFVLVIASCIMTYYAQKHGGAMVTLDIKPLELRLANAVITYATYLGKMAWPEGLAVLYPYPQNLNVPLLLFCALFLAGITFLCVRKAAKYPYLFTGWFYYLGTLVPVIGVVQVGAQSMADRYTYIPSIGIGIMVVWGAYSLMERYSLLRKIVPVAGVLYILGLSMVTWIQVGYWKDSETLCSRSIAVTSVNPVMHNNLGYYYSERGKIDRAIHHFLVALTEKSDYNEARNNLGIAYGKQDKHAEALAEFEKVIAADPHFAKAYQNIGIVYGRAGRFRDAELNFRKAIASDSSFIDARMNLGAALIMQNDSTGALDQYRRVLAINPTNREARTNAANLEGSLPFAR